MIPLIDISGFSCRDNSSRRRVVDQWRDALDSFGFLMISGHGIPDSVIDEAYDAATRFFDQPMEAKLAWSSAGRGAEGYIRLFSETVGATHGAGDPPDYSESLTFDGMALKGALEKARWPKTPEGLMRSVVRYAREAYRVALQLMEISALALELPERYFDPFFTPMSHRLRFAHYPEQVNEPEPGQLRNAPHTDYGGFTILRQDDAPGGLQVLQASGDWIDVPAIRDALVINTGDLIERWTNHRWVSNVHRVLNPPRSHTRPTKRLSMVFFTAPNFEAQVECLKTCESVDNPRRHDPVIVGDYIRAKLLENYPDELQIRLNRSTSTL